MQHVYLMHLQGFYKIGRSSNPERRAKQFLRTILPEVIAKQLVVEVVYSFELSDKNAVSVERALHKRFAHKRIDGEWFTLDNDDVQWFIDNAQAYFSHDMHNVEEQLFDAMKIKIQTPLKLFVLDALQERIKITNNPRDRMTSDEIITIIADLLPEQHTRHQIKIALADVLKYSNIKPYHTPNQRFFLGLRRK